ncbi:resuscitation-promoting factor [Aeromicrobium sp. Leaf350]|uniref:resuscitation-promoting factor n=1 Tax=Aeromicrobium sp. Leaf350 TaxID=2876565 RepID=UPI0027146ACC|nr:resuscitation-promoting factor [Aeromicrobium sp. Leaf350]
MKFPHPRFTRPDLLAKFRRGEDGGAKAPWVIALNVFVLLVLGGGATAYAAMSTTVELTVDGKTETIRTFDGTVEEVLEAQGIDLKESDKINVDLTSAPSSDQPVVVEYAKPVTVTVDGASSEQVTYAPTVGDLLDEHGVEPTSDDYVSDKHDKQIPRKGLDVVVSSEKNLTVVADGQTQQLQTAAPTVAEVLDEAEVKLGADDEVTLGKDGYVTPDAVLQVVRIQKEQRTEEVDVPFETQVQEDPEAFEGETTVVTPGTPGKATEKVDVVIADGQVRDRVVLERTVTTEPVAQVEKHGTKAAPVATGVAPDGVWGALAQCESGGNPAANTGNGYYGLYQFSASTWRAVGGSGLPSEASAEEQTMRAQTLQARSGWGQWPACSSKLGLR